MQTAALGIVMAGGAWLVAVALLMAWRPDTCLRLFRRMADTLKTSGRRQTLIEQGLRVLAGAALVVRAPEAKAPLAFAVFGWLLVASSLLILVLPMRWHAAYGDWWLERLTPRTVRWLSPVPVLAGAGLVYAAL